MDIGPIVSFSVVTVILVAIAIKYKLGRFFPSLKPVGGILANFWSFMEDNFKTMAILSTCIFGLFLFRSCCLEISGAVVGKRPVCKDRSQKVIEVFVTPDDFSERIDLNPNCRKLLDFKGNYVWMKWGRSFKVPHWKIEKYRGNPQYRIGPRCGSWIEVKEEFIMLNAEGGKSKAIPPEAEYVYLKARETDFTAKVTYFN